MMGGPAPSNLAPEVMWRLKENINLDQQPTRLIASLGAWSIPKGEFDDTEDPLSAAIREFREETGQEVKGEFLELQPLPLLVSAQQYRMF